MKKNKKSQTRDIDFLFEVGSLRAAQRAWAQLFGGLKTATILEHMFRVALLALIIARREGVVVDEGKMLQMALLHDLPESRTVDHAHVHKAYVKEDEDRAIHDLFLGTAIATRAKDVLKEYKERTSLEAKIVKDADNIDIDLEFKELEERGSKVPAKQQHFRRVVREEKLYTKAARELWDEIQTADPDAWQTSTNTWLASGKGHGR